MKKVFLQCLFVFSLLSLGSVVLGQVNYLPDRYQLSLDANGNVPPNFWSYEIPFKPVTESLTFINTRLNLPEQKKIDLISEKEDVDGGGDPTQYNQDKKKVDDLIQILAQGGVTLEDDERTARTADVNVAEFDVNKIGDSNLYLWNIGDLSFLVNPLRPTQVISLGFDNDTEEYLDSAKAQMLGPNVYRVFCNIGGRGNGCGAGTLLWLSIFDIDFNHSTWVRTDFDNISYVADLNKDGKYELVLDPPVVGDIYFPWVYGWDGTKWVDRRAEFWPQYENGQLSPEGFCNLGPAVTILDGLNQAIQNKEPLRYWKVAEEAVLPKGQVSEYLSSANKSLASKDYASAIADYQKALLLGNSNAKIYVDLGYTYILNGQMVEAQNALAHAIAWDNKSSLAHYNLALCDWVFRGGGNDKRVANAALEMVKALDLDPSLKVMALQTPNLRGLLYTPEFQFALFWRNRQIPDDFLKTFPNIPFVDWAGQTFVFLQNPGKGVNVWEDSSALKPVSSAVTLQGRTFKVLGPIKDFDPKQELKPQTFHIRMLDDGHRYIIHNEKFVGCAGIAPYQDYVTAKDKWLGHDLWCVSQQPVTLEKGTRLSKMEKVTVTDIQLADRSGLPIRLFLKNSSGVTDSIGVRMDFTNSEELFFLNPSGKSSWWYSDYYWKKIESGEEGFNYFCNLFTDKDPVAMLKEYLSQTTVIPNP